MKASELTEHIRQLSDEYATALPPDGDWDPLLFVDSQSKGVGLVAIDEEFMRNDHTKDVLAEKVIPNLAKEIGGINSIVFLASSWMRVGLTSMEEATRIRPSEAPDRIEALVLVGVSADEEVMAIGEIKRSENESPKLSWRTETEGMTVEGRFIGALRRALWEN